MAFITTFHIIDGRFPYKRRAVPASPGSRKTLTEEYTHALCGQLVVRDRGEFCGLSIASPFMRKPWCSKCVESVGWTSEAIEEWKRHGYFKESSGPQ